ncbi:MAG TPA: ABC transporter permease [Mobilitalea sp.]|nr:ABC transporter permease [Mobilitalea sp.]
MSFQLYIARLKCLVRNKEGMIWSFLFPIGLATCFFFAFNNFLSTESIETIEIAYISGEGEEDTLKIALEQAQISKDTPMFSINYCDSTEASEKLDDGAIEAYIEGGKEPQLYVKSSGMNETIVKSFLDSYQRISSTAQEILSENPNAINEGLMEDLMKTNSFVQEKHNGKNPNVILGYFYSLLAYTCLFAANWGMEEVINIQADQSTRGARVNVSPIHKMKLFIINMLAAFTVHCISIIIFYIYLYSALKVDFGDNLAYIFVTCLVGSLAGIMLGATIGVVVRKKASTKSAILTVVVLGGGFLSGMMLSQMKYLIATKAPIIGYINPVNLVTDAFYCLYYYDSYDRFYLNITILVFMTILMGAVSYMGLRRRSYASI